MKALEFIDVTIKTRTFHMLSLGHNITRQIYFSDKCCKSRDFFSKKIRHSAAILNSNYKHVIFYIECWREKNYQLSQQWLRGLYL